MKYLNDILQELGISKVRLAKYLGVSRQMVYNYLELPNLSKWPKEKKISLLKLLDIEDGDEETIKNIKVTTEYLMEVEDRLSKGLKDNMQGEYLDLKGLKKEEQQLVSDISFLIKKNYLIQTIMKKVIMHYFICTVYFNLLRTFQKLNICLLT